MRPRCSSTPPQICCNLCNPAEFENRYIVSLEKRKSQPRRSTMKSYEPRLESASSSEEGRVSLNYEPSENDKTFRKQLDSWQWEMANKVYTEFFTADFGCYTFMTDDVLNRICDASHFNLTTSVENLAKETRWNSSKEYGQHVIEIVLAAYPTLDSQSPVETAAPAPSASVPKPREMVCTGCGQRGHASEFLNETCEPNSELKPKPRACEAVSKTCILHC